MPPAIQPPPACPPSGARQVEAPAAPIAPTAPLRVIDGDTLALGERRIRLHGIDAPELNQTCLRDDGVEWLCGQAARDALAILVKPGITCVTLERDRYRREIARCSTAAGEDLGSLLTRAGWAVAFTRFSADYVADEDVARAARLGIWAGSFDRLEDHRATGRGLSRQAPSPSGQ